MSVNYDRVCRLCLSSRGELLPIFPTTSSDDSEPPVLASKIKDCVSIQITENDDLPLNVCRKCVDNVHNWHIFRSVCERTQNKLQSLIKKDGSQLEEVNIKSEPLSDEAYDDGVVIDGSYPDPENATSSKVQPEGPPILASLGLTPRSDKKYVDPRMDWQRVHAILDIIQDDEVIDSLQSTEELDVLQHSDHNSDSEIELTSDVEVDDLDTSTGYKRKNGETISKDPLISEAEIFKKGKESCAKKRKRKPLQMCYPQPKNAWQLLFTDELLKLIVSATNEKIKRKSTASAPTRIEELKALIGILYIHGIMRPTHQKSHDLWHSDLGVSCIKKAMKYGRYKFLLENLSFDIEQGDEDSLQCDVMKRMRKVFELFALNCREAFDIGSQAVIDETIVPLYGPCPFRYGIEKKPVKRHGIKLILLVDPSNFYISNLEAVTTGTCEPDKIITKLVQHLAGSRKTVVMDSWFSSLPLIIKLKTDYDLFSLAALNQKHEMLIPPLFVSKYRKSESVMTGFVDEDVALASYVNKDYKSVNVLTNEPMLYKKQPQFRSGTAVWQYKKTYSAVEVVDVLMHYYTTMQNCNDWALSLFFTMLNIASVNAQVIWSAHNSSAVTQRRIFLKELAANLLDGATEYIINVNSPLERKKLRISNSVQVQGTLPAGIRKLCVICTQTTKRQRKTRFYCNKCCLPVCGEHTKIFCVACT